MKLKKLAHEAMKNLLKKYQLLNPNHLVTIKNTSCYWQILAVRVSWHTEQPDIIFLWIRKHKYFLPVRNNWVVVCNLKYVGYSVVLNGVKWVVTYEWMSYVFEMLSFVLIYSNVFMIKLRQYVCSFRITYGWCMII